MMRVTVLAACLLATQAVAAQDAVADDSDYQADNSFSDASSAPAEAAAGGDADAGGATRDVEAAPDYSTPTDFGAAAEVDDSSADAGYDYGYGASDGADDDGGEPLELYAGADYVRTTMSFSKPALVASFGGDEFNSQMYRIRAGMRLFSKIGLEVQYGAGNQDVADLDSDEALTDQFYGVYLVPTGVLFDLVEVGAALGYARTELKRGGASEGLGGASFGLNFELPLLTRDSYALRLGAGGTVYRAQPSARIYGYHAGLRLDFTL